MYCDHISTPLLLLAPPDPPRPLSTSCTLFSFYDQPSPVCVAHKLMSLGHLLELVQHTRGHVLKDNWLSFPMKPSSRSGCSWVVDWRDFAQVLCSQPQLLWVWECRSSVMSRSHCFLQIDSSGLWLFHSLNPLSHGDPWTLGEEGWYRCHICSQALHRYLSFCTFAS